MWMRSELKDRAKEVLKGTYWKAFLVSLILSFVNGGSGGSSGGSGANTVHVSSGEGWYTLLPALIFIGLIAVAIGLLLRIFLGYPIEVSARRYFVQAAKGEVTLHHLGYSFKRDRYISIVGAMLYKGVLIFLWFLLLIIPGIVKAYAYSMVPYILSNNPNIGYKRAIQLSKQMTNGEKMNIFILDLSFIGWFLLGVLTFGIGLLFVMPYYNATKAELYIALRHIAVENGLSSREELNLTSM
ncbi:hypothetical protein BN1058_00058 [Paraliobacillus sp. PM-2]|uniref:DUF975 family protein n=1 Tax=Paraliobacillus sp. PM-2 TaxID=1462524 RepID=UPI00061C2B34|nr:DUF975 family protein [Paraliobacillus sp. PM-2]CQR45820.1 hypothetical protein BN1058_00058 [Paraliobacillus sp. PM-2]